MNNFQLNKKRIVLNTFFLYAKTFTTMIISLFSTRLVLEALGKMDFGIYGTVAGAIAMMEALNLSMAEATQRFINHAEGGNDKKRLLQIFTNSIIIHIIIGLFIVLVIISFYYPLFNSILNIPDDRLLAAKTIYFFMAISSFFTIITVPYDALINAHENFLFYSVVSIIVSILKLAAAFSLFHCMQDRLIYYGLLLTIITILNLVIIRFYCKKKYKECRFSPSLYGNVRIAKEIGKFAGWNFIGTFANIAGNHGCNIIMNHYFGPVIIGAKNIGDQICSQVAVLTSNMTKAINPVLMKSEGGGNRGTMIRLTFISCRYAFLLYMLLAIPFIFNADILLTFWLKSVPEWAVLFCQLQVIRTLLEQMFGSIKTGLIAHGTIRLMNMFDLAMGIITLIILFFLYEMGMFAYWHYIVSIIFMVLITGIFKLTLFRYYCNFNIKSFMNEVVKKDILTLSLSVLACYCISNIICSSIFNTLLCMLCCSMMILSVGINNEERCIIANYVKQILKNKIK